MPTTDNPLAEQSFREARGAEQRGEVPAAAAAYESFLVEHPHDPLAPVAELRLGRIALASGELERAQAHFDRTAAAEDAGIAEHGRLYLAVTHHLRGQHTEALELLRPLEGRLSGAEETALLMRTMAAACLQLGDRACGVRALDGLLRAEVSAADRDEAGAELTRVVQEQLSPETLATLYGDLPRDGFAWTLVAKRALREAFARGDLPGAALVATDLRQRNVRLEGELLAMAERAERTGQADPQVIGVILPLSGRGREVGQRALRAIMLAAGSPPEGPMAPDAVQVVVRDSGADPERAARAVDDLVSLHRVVAIIGPIETATAQRAARRAQELGVPLVSLSPVPSVVQAGPMVFRLFTAPAMEAAELARAAHARGARRFAVLYPDQGFGRAMRTALAAALPELGASLVAEATYATGATSFGDQVRALAAARPDAILVADRASQVALLAPALAAAGLWMPPSDGADAGTARVGPFLLIPSVGADAALLRPSARYLRGALFSVPFDPNATSGAAGAFRQGYADRYGEAPDVFAAYAYDAFRLVRHAVERGAITRAALAATLPHVRGLRTAGPSGGFDGDRQPARQTQILQWSGAGLVPAAPTPSLQDRPHGSR